MSKELSMTQQAKSQDALKHLYRQTGNGPFKPSIEVYDKKNNLLFLSENIDVTISDDFNEWKVAINWEDIGFTREGFRGFKLYGIFSNRYVKMSYFNGELEIDSTRIIKIRY